MLTGNPLLKFGAFPPFSAIQPEHVLPAVQAVLESNRVRIANLQEDLTDPSYENFVLVLDDLNASLEGVWGPVSHLNNVVSTPELRAAYESCLPLLSAYRSEISQNRALFEAFVKLVSRPDFYLYDSAQQSIIKRAIRDFKLAGVHLDEEAKASYRNIIKRLSELSSKFSNNALDATQAWTRLVEDETELSGVPGTAKALMKKAAEGKGQEGWLLTLDVPCVQAVLTYAASSVLREEVYHANITRASDLAPCGNGFDNTPVINEILQLRVDLCKLLGFANYAELSVATKMADSPEEVLSFLRNLASKSRTAGTTEYAQLREFGQLQGYQVVEPWDQGYLSEKYREQHLSLSQETLRQYFPAEHVLSGLFDLAKRLFNVEVRPLTDFDSWHPDVRLFEVVEEGQQIGTFYLDLYARSGKRAGAWMNGTRSRRLDASGKIHLPMAYIVCNFTPGANGRPALLTHYEVTTMFHEFGHGLHHLLTRVPYAGASGINGVEWDAVEFPSQFMENWCWQPDVLRSLSSHVDTNEPVPDDLVARLLNARSFQAGLATLRQVEIALFDFELHCAVDYVDHVQLMAKVREEVAVVPQKAYNRFATTFQHVFAGGYAAGYYSYKWAEVMAADSFGRFKEEGLFSPEVGSDFREIILAKGGSEPAAVLFKEFRGRAPKIDALLESHGLN